MKESFLSLPDNRFIRLQRIRLDLLALHCPSNVAAHGRSRPSLEQAQRMAVVDTLLHSFGSLSEAALLQSIAAALEATYV